MKFTKKSGWYAGVLLVCAMAARAAFVAYQATIVSTSALAYNASYVVDLLNIPGTYLSAQAVYSSATIPSASFTDGAQSTGSITIANYAALVSGVDNVRINGQIFTYGFNWATGASNSAVATTLATAINAAAPINTHLSAQASGAVVTATSTLSGSVYNYPLQASKASAVTLSGANMVNGAAAQFSLGSQIFTATNGNKLTLAYPVLYSTGTLVIGGLTNATTYYAVPLNGSSFELAKYSTSAVAGLSSDYVTVTGTNTHLSTSLNTYTLSALPITGTPGLAWSVSNDGINYVSLNVSSVTISSYVSGGATTIWPFGYIGERYVKLNATAPTAGGLNLVVTMVTQ